MQPQPLEKSTPIFTVRPIFDSTLTLLETIPLALVGGVLASFLLGTLFFFFFHVIGLGQWISGGIFTFFFFIGFTVSPALYFELKKSAYRRTAYVFYADYLEYQDFRFLLQRRKGRIRFSEIQDIFERANPMQSQKGLTTLQLAIPYFPGMIQRGMTGLKISDISEKSRFRDKIVSLIENPPASLDTAPAAAL